MTDARTDGPLAEGGDKCRVLELEGVVAQVDRVDALSERAHGVGAAPGVGAPLLHALVHRVAARRALTQEAMRRAGVPVRLPPRLLAVAADVDDEVRGGGGGGCRACLCGLDGTMVAC